MDFLKHRIVWASVIGSIALGGFVGLFFRLWAQLPWVRPTAGIVMTYSFLTLGPFAIGYLVVAVAEAVSPRPIWMHFILPWPAMLLSAGITYLVNLEGLICIVFALPITLVCSSLGGVVGGVITRNRKDKSRPMLAVALLMPMIFSPLESRIIKAPVEHHVVRTEIEIHAPASIVWDNIKRVRKIAQSELEPTWTHAIGFPRPVEATLSYEGVGGVRHASFAHGLMFIETVNQWDPDHVLAFSIKADTKDIPPTTLDSHVTIGGRYFDVLRGKYRIEPLSNGDVMLHLSSEERITTDFNGYAGFWSDAVMESLQKSILQVIRTRCEVDARKQQAMEVTGG
jgi:hypothetical protein